MASEATRALLAGAATLVLALAALTIQTLRIPGHAPHRVVAELRLAQAAAVLLAFSAAFLAGMGASAAGPVAALDMACAVLACGLALMTLVRDPRAALAWLGAAFLGRAVLDLGHALGWLPPVAAPRGVLAGSLVANLCAAACCALPLLRTPLR
ncbi:hypothetical protein TBR22_A37110 [Luteitalea sp. TBR-22]|uniref:hypothetical protein n=1 Tax=Luteitalea sp. TBR-22 TaxID=2802971 RepID=UPI001AFC07E4|nr:hypothetical protein [Luteitalea sp. TBR-22]BCS34484.1 hypothetical protein TBR22_A37110 [Luteitalea sp. TBR-22]